MFDRIIAVADGRALMDSVRSDASDLSAAHLNWLKSLLAESPASLQDVPLGNVSDTDLKMEWQAVFQGAGVAYYRARGNIVSICLLFDGKFPASENAAIDAVQQTVQTSRARSGGFDLVRKHANRPLRALVLMEASAHRELLPVLEYWSDCLATAYFDSVGVAESVSDRVIPIHGRTASAI